MLTTDFLTPIFQSLIASVIYSTCTTVADTFSSRIAFTKRYEKAFEKAVCRFYADSQYAGDEARRNYGDYVKMLQDVSQQDDTLSSNHQVYEKLFDLFVEEISKDKLLHGYTMLKNIFTTQKKLKEATEKIKESIDLARANHKESKQEHKEISEQINRLKELITNPEMCDLTLAPLRGSAVVQDGQESHIIGREQLVGRCTASLDAGKLLILYGALKVGKTTLAQIVAKKKEGVKIIDDVSIQNLEATVSVLLSARDKRNTIITTASALSPSFSTFDFSLIEQIEVPLLNAAETTELIKTFKPTSDLSAFIYGHTSGHPVLVKTLCSYFSTCGWKFNVNNFDQILSYSFDRNLIRSLSDLISRIIPDRESRNLLNRLLLVNGSFVETDVCQLAEVIPQIGEVRRRLYSLTPTWVTDNSGKFSISPLLNKLWRADIPSECKKQCYKVLAKNILDRHKPLNELDVTNYICYSVYAEEYDNAGSMYIIVLNKLHDAKETLPEKSLLRGIWIDLSLPAGMSPKIKIGIRLAQLLLLDGLSKKQRHYLLWDLKQLVDSYEADNLKGFLYSCVALICWKENEVAEGLRYYNSYHALDKKETETIMLQLGEEISLLDHDIWIFLLQLTTVSDFETWLDTFQANHIVYSHSDKEVCELCYLSVVRLITYHLRENDAETKLAALKQIWNKTEQCECPEVAIVCLFKMLDLFAIDGKYDEAKALYDTQYEKYKDYPLAVVLLNGAMAYTCYKTEHADKSCWNYFELATKSANKELIPDIQLHIKEIFAYVVAEKDPKQSVELLNEALEYAGNENYKVDVFEYYQCKGELSYAYWCIGERTKAVELLSECVNFVLPLAEAEKDFAKTYLCLCNCLIMKYSMDIQDKPLPAGQASPKRGMFTETYLKAFDELYSEERLYIACYQMSDLCIRLQQGAQAYKWAKKAVDTCRKKGEVEESHYLLFLLTPLFKADVDLDDIAFIIRHSDQARRVTFQFHPERSKGNNDLEFVEFQVAPLLMEALVLKMRGNDAGMELVRNIVKEYTAMSDEEAIKHVKMVFEQETYNRVFIAEINKLKVQEQYSVYLCAYIMTAYHSDSDYAFDLLIAIMPELQKQLVQIYGTRIMITVNRFVSTFWKTRIFKSPDEFDNYEWLKNKGVKLIDKYEGELNQSNKTMMVVHNHLKSKHAMNQIQEDWLDA